MTSHEKDIILAILAVALIGLFWKVSAHADVDELQPINLTAPLCADARCYP